MRRTRPLIALLAAYGLVLAAVVGAVAAGQAAAGAPALCRPSDAPGGQAPIPARHDLDCCIACGGASALPAPVPTAAMAAPAFTRLVWPAPAPDFLRASIDRRPSARAPPVGI